jgi:hypothetical protein
LPGSESVARVEGGARNRGGPESPCRSNCEGQAGREAQRQEASPDPPGVGLAHSIPRQGVCPKAGEGANKSTQSAQVTGAVRTTKRTQPARSPGRTASGPNMTFSRTDPFPNTAADADNDDLAISLSDAPVGTAIEPTTGVFTWALARSQATGAYSMTIRVTDNGVPNLSDSKSFTVTVRYPDRPVCSDIGFQDGQFRFQVHGEAGLTLVIESSEDLAVWTSIATNLVPVEGVMPLQYPTNFGRCFYRAKWQP